MAKKKDEILKGARRIISKKIVGLDIDKDKAYSRLVVLAFHRIEDAFDAMGYAFDEDTGALLRMERRPGMTDEEIASYERTMADTINKVLPNLVVLDTNKNEVNATILAIANKNRRAIEAFRKMKVQASYEVKEGRNGTSADNQEEDVQREDGVQDDPLHPGAAE